MKDFNITVGCNPITKILSDRIEAAVNESVDGVPLVQWSHAEKLQGSLDISSKELEKTIPEFDHIFDEQMSLASKVNDEINQYLESKINEYLEKNNLDFVDWSRHGLCKRWKARQEYFYANTFIAGVEIVTPMTKVTDIENLKTEYKLEIRYY